MSDEISEEKKTKMNEYANTCAQLGEAIVSKQLTEELAERLRIKAQELLNELKGMK